MTREQEAFASRIATMFASAGIEEDQHARVVYVTPWIVSPDLDGEGGTAAPIEFTVTEDAIEANRALDILAGVQVRIVIEGLSDEPL